MDQRICWYEKNGDDPRTEALRCADLLAETAEIEQRQHAWHQLNLWNALLYANRELTGFHWGQVNGVDRELYPANLHTENIIEEIGDAMVSKASSSPIRPALLDHGHSWKIARAVRVGDEFLFGVWRQTLADDACVRAYLDAYISCLGAVRCNYDDDTKQLSCEPIFFDNIIIDNRECIDRQQPRTVRIRQVLPRSGIEAKWGELYPDKDAGQYPIQYRQVGDGYEVIVEAFRRPNALGVGGWHSVACGGRMLVDEPWKHQWIPIEFYHWKDRLSGFFCASGVEQLVPYQVRQNNLNDAIEESQDIACRPRLLKQAATQINTEEWDNQAGRFLSYSGTAPTPLVWPTNLEELYAERERNIAAAKSHVAMSELFTNADAPPGVRFDSSAGLREFENIGDSRHLREWTRFEEFRLRVAKMLFKVLANHDGAEAFTTTYHPARARSQAKKIEFRAVKDLNADHYSWSMEAVPLSQMSPAARRELIRDFASRGLVDDSAAVRMMRANPNIERIEDLDLASFDDVDRHIDILESGGYERPTNFTNLPYGIWKVTANMHRLKVYDDVDPDIITAHEQWIVAATAIQREAAMMQQAMTPQPQPAAFSPTQGVAGTNAAVGAAA